MLNTIFIRCAALLLALVFYLYAFLLLLLPVLVGKTGNFSVANRSGEKIWITPISSVGGKSVLGHYVVPMLAVGGFRNERIPVPPGEVKRFAYQWYDSGFCEVAVYSQDKPCKVIRLAHGQAIPSSTINVPLLTELEAADVEAYGRMTKVRLPIKQYVVLVIALLLPLFLCRKWRWIMGLSIKPSGQ